MVYENFNKKVYHGAPQIAGSIAHQSIDDKKYSTSKKYLIGTEVYSEKLGICGKIDIYNTKDKVLIERKKRISKVYEGYKYQLYAQRECLIEMGFIVDKMMLYAIDTNKSYEISSPDITEWNKFIGVIERMQKGDLDEIKILNEPKKCEQCIYQQLCHKV